VERALQRQVDPPRRQYIRCIAVISGDESTICPSVRRPQSVAGEVAGAPSQNGRDAIAIDDQRVVATPILDEMLANGGGTMTAPDTGTLTLTSDDNQRHFGIHVERESGYIAQH
jgi:hypothetical protein